MAKQKISKSKSKPAKKAVTKLRTVKKTVTKTSRKKSDATKSDKKIARTNALKRLEKLAEINREKSEERKKKPIIHKEEIVPLPTHLELEKEMKHKDFPLFIKMGFEESKIKINE